MTALRVLVLLAIVLLPVSPSGAQTPARLLRLERGRLSVNFSLGTLPSPAFERKMRSGLTQRLIYRVLLKENPGDRAVAVALRYCAVTFDLWEESWNVECSGRGQTQQVTVARYSQLLRHVATLSDFSFPEKVNLSAQRRYWIEVQVQLNPISRKLLEKVKLWLRQSEKGSQFSGYMGSVLSLFVDKSVGGSDLTVTLRSGSISGREVLTP
ncbi:MAG: hypothetical protein CVU65_09815 [Deltaproteobacteria bacterium HGW-Deltaproteobacteria-22]|jgi:hypothetical protein|nr:MAG: hypothetical protein CVU65_09815 [Deltaproteobacteria bacterium HGW-Deltaproteobacteria-22]